VAYYSYLVATIAFTIYGQLILKWRIVKYGALPVGGLEKISFLLKLLLDPYIFSGLAAAFLSSMFWMAAMTKFDFSHAYPLIVGGLTLTSTLLAIFLLQEHLTIAKTAGLLLIVSGIIVIGRG